ncbi:MAG: hypothetical protein FWD90_04690 [Defluviitaleaceae bacterium]|nr:hypothetical protein [Defluviitaleaceae bacterium]
MKKFSKILSWVLVVALTLSIVPFTASASATNARTLTITQGQTLGEINNAIQSALEEMAASGGTLTITGAKTNVYGGISFSIPVGVTLVWDATYQTIDLHDDFHWGLLHINNEEIAIDYYTRLATDVYAEVRAEAAAQAAEALAVLEDTITELEEALDALEDAVAELEEALDELDDLTELEALLDELEALLAEFEKVLAEAATAAEAAEATAEYAYEHIVVDAEVPFEIGGNLVIGANADILALNIFGPIIQQYSEDAVITVNGGTLTANRDAVYEWNWNLVIDTAGDIVVNGGTLNMDVVGGGRLIQARGDIEINSGTLSGSFADGGALIQAGGHSDDDEPVFSSITVNNGTLNGYFGMGFGEMLLSSGKTVINGGVFTAEYALGYHEWGPHSGQFARSGIHVDDEWVDGGITVTGGEFNVDFNGFGDIFNTEGLLEISNVQITAAIGYGGTLLIGGEGVVVTDSVIDVTFFHEEEHGGNVIYAGRQDWDWDTHTFLSVTVGDAVITNSSITAVFNNHGSVVNAYGDVLIENSEVNAVYNNEHHGNDVIRAGGYTWINDAPVMFNEGTVTLNESSVQGTFAGPGSLVAAFGGLTSNNTEIAGTWTNEGHTGHAIDVGMDRGNWEYRGNGHWEFDVQLTAGGDAAINGGSITVSFNGEWSTNAINVRGNLAIRNVAIEAAFAQSGNIIWAQGNLAIGGSTITGGFPNYGQVFHSDGAIAITGTSITVAK